MCNRNWSVILIMKVGVLDWGSNTGPWTLTTWNVFLTNYFHINGVVSDQMSVKTDSGLCISFYQLIIFSPAFVDGILVENCVNPLQKKRYLYVKMILYLYVKLYTGMQNTYLRQRNKIKMNTVENCWKCQWLGIRLD